MIIAPAKNMATSPVIHLVPGGTRYIAYAATVNDRIKPDIRLINAISAKHIFVWLFILLIENMICPIGAANNNNSKSSMIELFIVNTLLSKR